MAQLIEQLILISGSQVRALVRPPKAPLPQPLLAPSQGQRLALDFVSALCRQIRRSPFCSGRNRWGGTILRSMTPRGAHQSRPREIATVAPRPKAEDVAERLRELEQRLANDSRTEAQKWLGAPSPDRSALSTAKRRLDT